MNILDGSGKPTIVSDGVIRNSVIGKQMLLEVRPTPLPAAPNWTIQGNTIHSQTFTDVLANTSPLPSPATSQQLQYYWLDGDYFLASVTMNAGGQNQTIQAIYNVETPSPTTMTAAVATPSIVQNVFELGSTANLAKNAGIRWTYKATAPKDFGGYFGETQLVKSNPSPVPTSLYAQFHPTGSDFYADGCAFTMTDANANNNGPVSAAKGVQTTFQTYDSPAYPLDAYPGLTSLSINDAFHDFFMFMPSGKNPSGGPNAWVSFEDSSWKWGGTASGSTNSWSLTNAIIPSGTNILTGLIENAVPTWPSRLAPDGLACPSIPSS